MNWKEIITNTVHVIKTLATIVGVITIFLIFLEKISSTSPLLSNMKAKTWGKFYSWLRYKKLAKKAIKNDTEATVNSMVVDLQKELPPGWIRKLSIQWLKETSLADLKDEELIMRLRPLEDQDQNLLNSVFAFFKEVIFPKTKTVVPNNIYNSSALLLAHKTLSRKKLLLQDQFERQYIEKAILEDGSVASYFGSLREIDKRGFFTGAFLREADEICERARLDGRRKLIPKELDSILEHMKIFTKNIENKKSPESLWFWEGDISSYSFLLVAFPATFNLEPYLNRIKEKYDKKIERIYVLANQERKSFAQNVISAVQKQGLYKLEEIYDLNSDYRGEYGGIGALFVRKK